MLVVIRRDIRSMFDRFPFDVRWLLVWVSGAVRKLSTDCIARVRVTI